MESKDDDRQIDHHDADDQVERLMRHWHPNDLILSVLVTLAAVVFALAAVGWLRR